MCCDRRSFRSRRRGVSSDQDTLTGKERAMLAAIGGIGIIGIIVVVLIVLAVLYFARRA